MLKDRIVSTLQFFDLQHTPLTLLELHRFLLADMELLKSRLNSRWELTGETSAAEEENVGLENILHSIEHELKAEVVCLSGFYCLSGRERIVHARLSNYRFGLGRERLIGKYIGMLKYVPFVRGVALGGSQALGQQKEDSDIDLLIITDKKYLFLGRLFVTLYFQVTGKRRHGAFISNRFCLNHYLSWPKPLSHYRNLYTAMEYGRLRPLVYAGPIGTYQKNNEGWIRIFFPNWLPAKSPFENQSGVQRWLEKVFNNPVGQLLEKIIGKLQLAKIRNAEFIVVLPDELSFHPDSKQLYLLDPFFNSH